MTDSAVRPRGTRTRAPTPLKNSKRADHALARTFVYGRSRRAIPPLTKLITKRTINTKNKIFAMPAAAT
jgi:hypothetical protein